MAAAPDLPTGVVTFLLTDVEASTRLWRESAEAATAMRRMAEIIAAAVARHGGVQPLEQGEGDSTVSSFSRASDALTAALEAQRALRAETWPGGRPLRVRMAVHTGEAELRAPGLYGGAGSSAAPGSARSPPVARCSSPRRRARYWATCSPTA